MACVCAGTMLCDCFLSLLHWGVGGPPSVSPALQLLRRKSSLSPSVLWIFGEMTVTLFVTSEVCVLVCEDILVPQYVCGDQKTTLRNWFSLRHVGLGSRALRSSGSVARAFTLLATIINRSKTIFSLTNTST